MVILLWRGEGFRSKPGRAQRRSRPGRSTAGDDRVGGEGRTEGGHAEHVPETESVPEGARPGEAGEQPPRADEDWGD